MRHFKIRTIAAATKKINFFALNTKKIITRQEGALEEHDDEHGGGVLDERVNKWTNELVSQSINSCSLMSHTHNYWLIDCVSWWLTCAAIVFALFCHQKNASCEMLSVSNFLLIIVFILFILFVLIIFLFLFTMKVSFGGEGFSTSSSFRSILVFNLSIPFPIPTPSTATLAALGEETCYSTFSSIAQQ